MRLLLLAGTGAIGAERNDDHLPDDVLAAAAALAAHEWVLDDRHHAVRSGGDKSRLDRVEQVLVYLDAIEGCLIERSRNVTRCVVLEPQVRAHAQEEDVAQ